MSIAGTYQNINGVVIDRRRRPLARRRRLIDREAWVIEAGDIILNVGFTILIDSTYSGPASVTPQLGTRNIYIVSAPLKESLVLTEARDDELVTVDAVIDVDGGEYVLKELVVRPRASKAIGKKTGKKAATPQESVAQDVAAVTAKKPEAKKPEAKGKEKPKARKGRSAM
jgi:hypothetical protein